MPVYMMTRSENGNSGQSVYFEACVANTVCYFNVRPLLFGITGKCTTDIIFLLLIHLLMSYNKTIDHQILLKAYISRTGKYRAARFLAKLITIDMSIMFTNTDN